MLEPPFVLSTREMYSPSQRATKADIQGQDGLRWQIDLAD